MDNQLFFRSSLSAVDSDSRTIEGVAVVFNKWSQDLGGFIERVIPTAISQELIAQSDVIANYEHNSPDYMMARSRNGKGTLQLELKEDGLYFRFEAPTTSKGDELLYHVRNGNITECSFCFALAPDSNSERWYKNKEGKLCRDICKIGGLYDISLVQVAAYPDTYCHTRSVEKAKEVDDIIVKDLEERLSDVLKYEI